jgi:hypothetical protein
MGHESKNMLLVQESGKVEKKLKKKKEKVLKVFLQLNI